MKIKPKKCKNCGCGFMPLRSTTERLCGLPCALEWSKNNIKKKEEKDWKEKKKVMKEKLKTLTDWKDDLQEVINQIVRLIDKGVPCIATGATTGKMNAGHYISRGSNDTIRYHLDNIHIQSEHSNSYNGGDTHRYQDGIIKVYGKEYLESMNALKSTPVIKLTVDEIKEKISICRGIVKWLKLQERTYNASERLELRTRFNKQIGIYQKLIRESKWKR